MIIAIVNKDTLKLDQSVVRIPRGQSYQLRASFKSSGVAELFPGGTNLSFYAYAPGDTVNPIAGGSITTWEEDTDALHYTGTFDAGGPILGALDLPVLFGKFVWIEPGESAVETSLFHIIFNAAAKPPKKDTYSWSQITGKPSTFPPTTTIFGDISTAEAAALANIQAEEAQSITDVQAQEATSVTQVQTEGQAKVDLAQAAAAAADASRILAQASALSPISKQNKDYLYFDGSNDGTTRAYFILDSATDPGEDDFTVVVENIKVPDSVSDFEGIWSLSTDTAATVTDYSLNFYFNSDGSLRYRLNGDPATSNLIVARVDDFVSNFAGQVVDIVVVAEASTVTFYCNGVELTQSSEVGVGTLPDWGDRIDATYFVLGVRESIKGFRGSMGKVYIINRPLSADDVLDLALAGPSYADSQTGSMTVQTSGTLKIGCRYRIQSYVIGDDFLNVGGTNSSGIEFIATGTTPTTWANGSEVVRLGKLFDPVIHSSRQIADLGENGIHGILVGGVTPVSNRSEPIVFENSATNFARIFDEEIIVGPHSIDEIWVKDSGTATTVTIRDDVAGNVIVAAIATSGAGEWEQLTVIPAQKLSGTGRKLHITNSANEDCTFLVTYTPITNLNL